MSLSRPSTSPGLASEDGPTFTQVWPGPSRDEAGDGGDTRCTERPDSTCVSAGVQTEYSW